MGNLASSGGANRMAIAAMANGCNFTKDELIQLQTHFRSLSKSSDPSDATITKNQLSEALKMVGVHEDDDEVIHRLFTLFDDTGDDVVNFKEFVVGCSTLVRGSTEEKLKLSFELYDVNGDGVLSKDEIKGCLNSMSSTSSFFGDTARTAQDVNSLVDQIFDQCDQNKDGVLNFSEYMNAIATFIDEDLVTFISAKPGKAVFDK